jgi:hypothetical protein
MRTRNNPKVLHQEGYLPLQVIRRSINCMLGKGLNKIGCDRGQHGVRINIIQGKSLHYAESIPMNDYRMPSSRVKAKPTTRKMGRSRAVSISNRFVSASGRRSSADHPTFKLSQISGVLFSDLPARNSQDDGMARDGQLRRKTLAMRLFCFPCRGQEADQTYELKGGQIFRIGFALAPWSCDGTQHP